MLRSAAVLALLALPALADDPAPAFAQRFGDKADRLKDGGGGAKTEAAARAGLLWLARHQTGGAWRCAKFADGCFGGECPGAGQDEFDTGVTGLALLAFLGAGITPDSDDTWTDPVTGRDVRPGKVVKRAATWLENGQNQDGSFGPRNGTKLMYNHAIATAAMCELYGMTREAAWKNSASAAIAFLLDAQNPDKAWRYAPKGGDNDTSVTSWCVQALHAAEAAGLEPDKKGVKGALAWVKEVTDRDYGRVGYTARGTGKVVIMGRNEDFDHHETLTAVGMLVRLCNGAKPGSQNLHNGAKLLVADLPNTGRATAVDVYYWYHGTEALWEGHGPDTKYWTAWNKALKDALLDSQADGRTCEAGSWDPAKDRWGFEGGRVFTTALGTLTLEVYYRWAPGGHGDQEK